MIIKGNALWSISQMGVLRERVFSVLSNYLEPTKLSSISPHCPDVQSSVSWMLLAVVLAPRAVALTVGHPVLCLCSEPDGPKIGSHSLCSTLKAHQVCQRPGPSALPDTEAQPPHPHLTESPGSWMWVTVPVIPALRS